MPDTRLLFSFDLPIRWGDMDALGHVNNAHYFRYFEETRIQWLKGVPGLWGSGRGFVVAHAACTYKKPVVYPATLRLDLRAEAPRRSSVVTHYDVYRADAPDTLCATGQATMVWIDLQTGRPVSLPSVLHELWNEQANNG